ncbi:hypothetical protein AGR5A_Cc10040 [Agrobacterium genomosp. 5 str. CFBP 6626]|nr:hypothetical protein AGR5A_Cc10040 [Agrobacterium genomosp. 5 str. CFBP 6626]
MRSWLHPIEAVITVSVDRPIAWFACVEVNDLRTVEAFGVADAKLNIRRANVVGLEYRCAHRAGVFVFLCHGVSSR